MTINKTEADKIARSVEWTGYITLRVFSDGSWISPATAAHLDRGLTSQAYVWHVGGYRSFTNPFKRED